VERGVTRFLAGSVEFDADGSASDVVGRVESLLGLTLESDRVETGVAEYFAGDVLGLRVHLEVPVEAPRRCTLSYRADNRYAGDFGEPVDVDFHFARILRGE
jgi:hypothetical protein